MPGGPYSSTPFGIFAPRAWYLAGFCRKSLISCSSCTASSAPATSAKVVFGVSFATSLAFDLPKLSTRLPPPCICDMNSSSRITSTAIGSRLIRKLSRTLSLVTLVSNVSILSAPCRLCSSAQISSIAWAGTLRVDRDRSAVPLT